MSDIQSIIRKLEDMVDFFIYLVFQILCTHLCTAFTVDTSRDDATGVACALTTGEESLYTDVLQRSEVAGDAHGRRGAGLGGDKYRLVGEKTVTHLAEFLEAFLQTFAHVLRHPEVKGRRYESGGIAALGQVVAQAVVHEVCHALRRSGLLHVALLPARTLQFFLEMHHAQRIVLVAAHVLGACLYDHARVGPLRTAVAGAHAVDHELLLVGSRRNDETAGAHAERVDAASVHLRHEAVLGCRQILAASVARVIRSEERR